MAVIYKTTDKIKYYIDDIIIKVSPLTYAQKMEVQDFMNEAVKTSDMKYAMDGAICAIKYSLKSISGLKTTDGEDYQLEFEDKRVSEECINDLLNMSYSQKITSVCTALVSGITDKIIDPNTNKEITGISFEDPAEKKQ